MVEMLFLLVFFRNHCKSILSHARNVKLKLFPQLHLLLVCKSWKQLLTEVVAVLVDQQACEVIGLKNALHQELNKGFNLFL